MSVHELLAEAARFELGADEAKKVLAQVVAAVGRWQEVARSPIIGMVAAELETFAPAFEHSERDEARALVK